MTQQTQPIKQTIVVTASFTAEPIEESVAYWTRQLGITADIAFAPYNQVFQQLLDPASLTSQNHDGINVVLIRLEDWLKYDRCAGNQNGSATEATAEHATDTIRRTAGELIEAIKSSAARSNTPMVVCVCPASPQVQADASRAAFFQETEERLAEQLSSVAGVYLSTTKELWNLYPVLDYYDSHGDDLGHVPFTPPQFAALGTLVARKIHAVRSAPYKVVVLDCDQTLWKGVCGEDGPDEIRLDLPYKTLQEFMVRQLDAGMMICLCSKNNENDVLEVFDRRTEMPLSRKHITSVRANWQPKSTNIRSLAEELNLGLDSFIFIDDNPVECAEVQANCPEALTLRLPEDPERIPRFLNHIWAFDHLEITDEDKRRTELYQQNIERARYAAELPTFRDFIEGLELDIHIQPMRPEQLPRVSQLTQRTNQFNATTLRRSEKEIRELCEGGSLECLVVEVRDRFGDYGLVGAVLFEATTDRLVVDTFLLSCRVLGKGVEHCMLAKLGEMAVVRGVERVDITYSPSEKNSPVATFLQDVVGSYGNPRAESTVFSCPAAVAAEIALDPDSVARRDETRSTTSSANASNEASSAAGGPSPRNALLNRIADELNKSDRILNAIKASTRRARPDMPQRYVAPRTSVEETLAEIWANLLDLDRIGMGDNLLSLGANSLMATQMVSQVRDATGVDLSLRALVDGPTVGELASVVSEQAKHQPHGATKIDELPAVIPEPEQQNTPFPLTEIQQAYWAGRGNSFDLGNVGTHVYYEIDGDDLDVDQLSRAWQQLIERHEMLRTIIRPDGQQQVLSTVDPYEIEVTDLRCQDPETTCEQLEQIRQQRSHQVLPSDRWPIFDIRATRYGNDQIRLHISFDALTVDLWSLYLLFAEWSQLYDNPATELPPLELSFRDYVAAESKVRDTQLYRDSQTYWKQRLATLPAAPDLPLAKSPASISQSRFVRRTARLDAARWQRLKDRAAEVGLTHSAVLLTAFSEVLNTWSKTSSFTINLTLYNRLPLHTQVEDIVGDFTSLSLHAVDHTVQDTFQERARRIQGKLWEDLDHRYVSGVEVMRERSRMQGGRDSTAMPVVFTSGLVHNAKIGDRRPMGWLGETVYSITQTPQVWLDQIVTEDEGALVANWDVVEELFPAGLIDAMLESYRRLLDRLIDDEEAWQESRFEAAQQLLPVGQAEKRDAVNATDEPISSELLHTLFASQSATVPDNIAVITSDRTLTYKQLATRANQVGHWLKDRGAKPNTLIAVVMEKGWEQIVGAMGILNSGAAYLPINPSLPQERLSLLLEHGEVSLILTQSKYEAELSWPDGIERLSVDTVAADDLDGSPLPAIQKPTDLAYVIYTSGSTGVPKGVVIDHRGAVNTVLDVNRRFQVDETDRIFAISSLSFDLSVYDVFGALAAGAAIVIPDATASRDPGHWARLIDEHKVTIWNSVPALMEMLVEFQARQDDASLDSLRLVMLSGDWIPLTLPKQIWSATENVELVSLGGATEASIWSILFPINEVDPSWNSVPYGRPMVNQKFYVLNERFEPCPEHVPGQLFIGGIGLALGYWRDEEKTAASFLTHPETGERLYRTGDLGRYLPSGDIEFLGREDFQVKIQGHRIELGEIEAALLQHPTVANAVVAAVGERFDNKKLVAYYIPEENASSELPVASDATLDEGCEQAVTQTTTLSDPIDRLRFKLDQRGLRDHVDRPSVALSSTEVDGHTLDDFIARRSYRSFDRETISFEQLSVLLGGLRQRQLEGTPFPKRLYASAGGLYPVQTYLYVKPNGVEGVEPGTYYYHPGEHRLISLASAAPIGRDHFAGNQAIFDQASFAIFLVAQLRSIAPMYQEHARDFCLLEAGMICQHLESSSPSHDVGLCQIGGFNFSPIAQNFDLDDDHVYLNCLIGGGITAEQKTLPALVKQIDPVRSMFAVAKSRTLPEFTIATSQPSTAPSAPLTTSADPVGEQLRGYLRDKLPDYMVPSAVIPLSEFPLTANGKVNRNALPEPEHVCEESAATFVAPQTELEEQIASVWKDVLKIDRVGVHDNFFELGGDSISAIKIIAELNQAGFDLNAGQLFVHQTIADLASNMVASTGPEIGGDQAVSANNGSDNSPPAPTGKDSGGDTFGWSETDLGDISAALNRSVNNND